MSGRLAAAGLLALLVVCWEVAVRALAVPAYLLPPPSGIAAAAVDLRDALPAHVTATVTTALLGLAVAAVVGVALAVLIASVPLIRRVAQPLLVTSQSIPMIVLAPLLIAWFGFGLAPKVAVVALIAFFPIVVSTADGLTGADRDLVDLIRSMGGDRRALLRHVLIPSALPGFFAGLTVAAAYAMIGAVIAEWMGASVGLGLLLTRSAASFRIDQVFVGIALLAGISIGLFVLVRLAARLVMPWRALAALLLAAVALSACGARESDLRPVTLMLNWTPNTHHAGIYAALENGWYADAGLDVEIIEPSQAGSDQAVGTGQVEFGVSQAESVLPARAAGVPVVSIATLLPSNDSTLMALADEGIDGPGDLAGKTYGGFGGALETELIARLVECGGGDPAAVEFVEVGNVDYLSGLQQDRFDFVWVFNGWDALRATVVEDAEIATVPFDEHLDCIPDWYTPVLIANEQTIADDPDLVRAFLEATTRGYELAGSNPQEASSLLLSAVPELDRTLVVRSAEYYAERFGDPWGVQDEQVWQSFAAFLAEAGLTEDEVDTAAAFSNDFLP